MPPLRKKYCFVPKATPCWVEIIFQFLEQSRMSELKSQTSNTSTCDTIDSLLSNLWLQLKKRDSTVLECRWFRHQYRTPSLSIIDTDTINMIVLFTGMRPLARLRCLLNEHLGFTEWPLQIYWIMLTHFNNSGGGLPPPLLPRRSYRSLSRSVYSIVLSCLSTLLLTDT